MLLQYQTNTMAETYWQNLSLFFGVMAVIAVICRSQCPPNCRCLSVDVATCRLHTPHDYKAFSHLSGKTTAMTLVIKGSFREDLADFSSLGLLENMTLTADRQYSSYQEAVRADALNTFKRHDLLQNLTNLKSLSISLVIKSFDSILLTPLRQLKTLSFSYTYMFDFNDFINITNVTGKYLLKVEEFRMVAVQRVITPGTILKLKEHIYEPLQNLTLKVLDLSNNMVVLLQQGMSTYLPYLEVIRISATELMHFEKTEYSLSCNLAGVLMHAYLREYSISFPKKTTVEYIDKVGDISLNTINERDKVLYCIKHLHISSDLCAVANCVCEGQTILPCPPYGKEIHLKDIIVPPKRGQTLALCVPPPPSLETFIYQNYPSLAIAHTMTYCFHQSNWSNVVRYADISYNDIGFELSPTSGITGLPQLRFLNLQGNKIVFSDETLMSDMPSLKVLLLGNNDIKLQGDLDFLLLGNLTVLDLENCRIDHMPVNSLTMLRRLEILNLSRNMLSEFEVNIANLGNLKLLNLSNNDIRTLGEYLRRQLDTQDATLDISGNPLSCYCDNIDFVQWLQSTSIQFVRKDVTKCSHPTLQLVSPWKVDVNALHRACIHFDAIMSSVGSASGMALVITAIFVLYKRRWRIRYWLYAAKESWRQRREQGEGLPLLTKEYTYDAFVAYSSHGEERSWVHTTLREKLESEHGLKLCMYHRNFKVGRNLAETIVEGINSSNKTLLILSPNFLNSGWCEFEVRMANEKVINERRDSMVIVIFKHLEETGTKLPKMLSRLMEKKIYIEWTDDPDGQRLFWRRLVDSIKTGTHYDAFNDLCEIN